MVREFGHAAAACDMRYRRTLFVCLILAGNALLLFVLTHTTRKVTSEPSKHEFHVSNFLRSPPIRQLFVHNQLFVIEPHLLAQTLHEDQLEELRWRFDLQLSHFEPKLKCLTLGLFASNKFSLPHHLIEVGRVEGVVPYEQNEQKILLHLFVQWRQLNVHIVFFHKIKHFLWIGQIPTGQLSQLTEFSIHFGQYEAIFDPFALNRIDSVLYPDEVTHFLSQIPNSRFLFCTENRRKWLARNNMSFSGTKLAASEEAILGFKSLMKKLKMQFWIACGTLLGWLRQCHITPYTTDTDFATWGKYLQGQNVTSILQRLGPEHGVRLRSRYGEPVHSMEYSFLSMTYREKVDLFFIYPNGTHFLLPFHMPSTRQFAYSIYPNYELCSVELLGHKLLAPCSPEQVILAEYGSNWREPLPGWDYANSPLNCGPSLPFTANISQEEHFF